MTQNFQPEPGNTSFDILNTSGEAGILYRLNAPFQVTLESCSGTENDDCINIWTFSPMGVSSKQKTVKVHNTSYQQEAPHYHNYYEFLIVLKGSIYQQIEGKEYLYSEGAACLINRNLRHKEIFREASQVLFLGFSPESLLHLFQGAENGYYEEERSILSTALYHFIREDMHSPGRKAYLDFLPAYQNKTSVATFHQTIETLIYAMLFPCYGATPKIDGLFSDIFRYLVDAGHYHCSMIELDSNRDYLIFSRIEHLLEENNGRLSRAKLSEVLYYSGDYLNRIVNKYTGLSLHEYGMKLCMKKAARELQTTTASISEIAERLEFTNRTYFYRIFEKYYGMTPRAYRVAHRIE